MRLRTIFLLVSTLLLSATTASLLTLLSVTSQLHHATTKMSRALDGVWSAKRLQVDLMMHAQASQFASGPGGEATSAAPSSLHAAERQLGADLAAARRVADTSQERLLLARAERAIDTYLATVEVARAARLPVDQLLASSRAARDESMAALHEFVELNVAYADEVHARVRHWDERSMVMGAAAIGTMLFGVMLALLLGRFGVYQPLMALRDAVQRIGAGARGTRVPERGPAELRDCAHAVNEMAEKLERKRTGELQFLAGVAHDLRNPLTALAVTTTGLVAAARAASPPSGDRTRHVLDLVARQVNRLNRMIDDLLDATRIEAGQLDLRMEACDARDLAREAAELYRGVSPAHHLAVTVEDDPLPIQCDPTRIAQVLNNLLSNAVKYSPAGGEIRIGARRVGSTVRLEVHDSGVGIAANELNAIFEPFRRSDSSRDKIPGVGLGLSVARRLVEAQSGHIEVTSEPGRGSTFSVSLPLAGEPAAARAETPSHAHARLARA